MIEYPERIRAILEAHDDILVAFVFGSATSGRERQDSDLDVGVAGPDPLSPSRKLAIMDELACSFGRPIDLVDLATAPPLLLRQVLTKGVIILKRDVSTYAWLLRKLWYDQADIMPNYRSVLRRRRERFIHGS